MSTVPGKRMVLVAGMVMVTSLGGGIAAAAADVQLGWEVAAPVAAVSDPVAADGCPIEAPDGKALFFASVRSGGDNDIWMSTRTSVDAEFGDPVMLPTPVNSDAQDFCPTPLHGGALLFVSTRGGTDAYGTVSCGLGDVYVTRQHPGDGTWTEPRNLGCAPNGPNSAGMEYGPSLVATKAGIHLYFSSGGLIGAGTQDIYVSRLGAGLQFGAPTAVAELNLPWVDDYMPNVSRDGREIVFVSTRPGGFGASDIYTSTRSYDDGVWREVANLGPTVNTAAGESRPTMSADGERLYFGRNGDIYVSQRIQG
jgi:hypothetical protein